MVSFGVSVDVCDPQANIDEVNHEYGLTIMNQIPSNQYDGILLAVSHNEFIGMDLSSYKKTNSVVYDIKGILPAGQYDARL